MINGDFAADGGVGNSPIFAFAFSTDSRTISSSLLSIFFPAIFFPDFNIISPSAMLFLISWILALSVITAGVNETAGLEAIGCAIGVTAFDIGTIGTIDGGGCTEETGRITGAAAAGALGITAGVTVVVGFGCGRISTAGFCGTGAIDFSCPFSSLVIKFPNVGLFSACDKTTLTLSSKGKFVGSFIPPCTRAFSS